MNHRKQSKFTQIQTLTLSAFLIASVGWAWEMIFAAFILNSPNDRGFLILPLCPIYGIAVLLVYICLKTPRDMHMFGKDMSHLHLACRYLLYFVLSTALATLFELVTGWFFTEILHINLWNYVAAIGAKFKYVALGPSLAWGAGMTAFMGLIYAPMLTFIGKCRPKIRNILFWTLIILLVIDAIFNFSYVLIKGEWFNLNEIIRKLK